MQVKLFEESSSEFLENAINDFLGKEGPLTIEKIKYQVTPWDAGESGLVFSALMTYEYTEDLIKIQDQILKEINCGIKDDDNV